MGYPSIPLCEDFFECKALENFVKGAKNFFSLIFEMSVAFNKCVFPLFALFFCFFFPSDFLHLQVSPFSSPPLPTGCPQGDLSTQGVVQMCTAINAKLNGLGTQIAELEMDVQVPPPPISLYHATLCHTWLVCAG